MFRGCHNRAHDCLNGVGGHWLSLQLSRASLGGPEAEPVGVRVWEGITKRRLTGLGDSGHRQAQGSPVRVGDKKLGQESRVGRGLPDSYTTAGQAEDRWDQG